MKIKIILLLLFCASLNPLSGQVKESLLLHFGKFKHFDSILNGHHAQNDKFDDKKCFQEIDSAKIFLQKINRPIFVVETGMIMSPWDDYNYYLKNTCSSLNIHYLENFIECEIYGDGPQNFCFYNYFEKDLKLQKGKSIIDSIHKFSLLRYIQHDPKRDISFSRYFNGPEPINYTFKNVLIDTFYYSNDNNFELDSTTKRTVAYLHHRVDSSGDLSYPEDIIYQFAEDKEYPVLSKKIALYIKRKYPKWQPAYIFDRKISSKIIIAVVLLPRTK